MSGVLVLQSLTTGDELDRVTLVEGTLTFATGAARALFDADRARMPDADDAALFKLRADWTNGYLRLRHQK